MRPDRLVFVAGTATDVGKTWCAARVAASWRARGLVTAARKPVQSFATGEEGSTDADVLAAATGEAPTTVCPAEGWFPTPLAPPMAAEVLGRPCPSVAELVARCAWAPGTDVGLVEGVGSVRSPMASDGDNLRVIEAVRADVVLLVADAALGTIGAVRSNLDSLGGWPAVVLLNRYDPADDLHRRNRDWLAHHDGLPVVVGPEVAAEALVPR